MNYMKIAVNARVLSQPITGVQRYLLSLLQHFPEDAEVVRISANLKGIKGHVWEQIVLPLRLGKHFLWSPGNTGPLFDKNQVVTIHDTVPLDHPEWLNPRFAIWYRFLVPYIARRASAIIAVSHFTKERIIATCKVSGEKIHVVYNGVDNRFSPTSKKHVDATKKKLRIPGLQYVLAFGSIEPRKNLRRLIEAWESIADDLPGNIWLVVAGAKGARRVFDDEKLQAPSCRVHFTGRVPDELVPSLYSGAMATAYVSLYEGFGLPVLEAMACGSPVLTSDTTALPEVAGKAAFLVNPYQVNDIAVALYRLIQDENLQVALRDRGLKRARRFTWKRAALETLRILRKEAESS